MSLMSRGFFVDLFFAVCAYLKIFHKQFKVEFRFQYEESRRIFERLKYFESQVIKLRAMVSSLYQLGIRHG